MLTLHINIFFWNHDCKSMDHRRPSSPGNNNIREVRDVLLHDHDDDGIVFSST